MAIDNNEVKNNTKNDKVFSNYKIDNVTRVGVVDNHLERELQWMARYKEQKSYAEILKSDRNTTGKLREAGTKDQLIYWRMRAA